MLAGNLSNQDEDEVEEELAALQGPVVLPEPPTTTPKQPETPEDTAAEAERERTEQGEVVRKKARAAVPAS